MRVVLLPRTMPTTQCPVCKYSEEGLIILEKCHVCGDRCCESCYGDRSFEWFCDVCNTKVCPECFDYNDSGYHVISMKERVVRCKDH